MPILMSVGLVPNSCRGDVRDDLNDLDQVDHRGAVWCAALCAATVQWLALPDHREPAATLRLAMLWAQGVTVSRARMKKAARTANRGDATGCVPWPSYAAHITACCVYSDDDVADSATAACNAVSLRFGGSASAYKDHLGFLGDLVEHQRTPIAPEGPGAHPLWDWTLEHHPNPMRVGTLSDALARARRWRLRWWRPHERAIAERLSEPPRWAKEAA